MTDIFILGSGFSADLAGLPTLRQLSEELYQRIQTSPGSPSKSFLLDAVPTSLRGDLERVLTYLVQQYPWRGDEDAHIAQGAYVMAARTIQEVLRDQEAVVDVDSWAGQPINHLLDLWHAAESTVITFNYDTLIERLAAQSLKYPSAHYDREDGENFAFLSCLIVTVDPNDRREPDISFDERSRALRVRLPGPEWPQDDLIERLRRAEVVPEEHFSMSGSKGAELRAKVAVKPLLAWKTQDCPKCREVYPALSETEVDIFILIASDIIGEANEKYHELLDCLFIIWNSRMCKNTGYRRFRQKHD